MTLAAPHELVCVCVCVYRPCCHRYQNRRTKWKRQTAVGIELLAEAGNLAAVQSVYQSMGFPWPPYGPPQPPQPLQPLQQPQPPLQQQGPQPPPPPPPPFAAMAAAAAAVISQQQQQQPVLPRPIPFKLEPRLFVQQDHPDEDEQEESKNDVDEDDE